LTKLKRNIKIITIKILTKLFSETKWYSVAVLITYLSKFFKPFRSKKNSIGFFRAQDLNSFLSLMTREQKYFHIPYTISGLEHLNADCGIILCSVHVPLVKVALRGLIEHEIDISAAIVGLPPASNTMSVWGITDKIPIIARNPFSLLKAKKVLEHKGKVVVMIDNPKTHVYSPNIMKLCGKIDAKVVFFFAELNAQNVIDTYFIEAPFSNCRNEEEIKENLLFLKKKHDQILENYTKATF
jgi:hypothetical protein